MGILDKLFGGKNKEAESTSVADPVDCPHAMLVPRWETVQDMGHEDKATRFLCETCHQEFTPEEAQRLKESMAERLRLDTENESATEGNESSSQ